MEKQKHIKMNSAHSIKLLLCDLSVLLAVILFMMVIYPSRITEVSAGQMVIHFFLCAGCLLAARMWQRIYNNVWRYNNTALYLKLLIADCVGGIAYMLLQHFLPFMVPMSMVRACVIVLMDLLGLVALRMVYQYLYEHISSTNLLVRSLVKITSFITDFRVPEEERENKEKGRIHRINIAIIGAGRVGVALASELLNNPNASYYPCCFIDADQEKAGRTIMNIPVYSESEGETYLSNSSVQEVVFAIPDASAEKKQRLYERYKQIGCRMKVYDYPIAQTVEGGKRQMREFDIEELLFRNAKEFTNERTKAYYKGKVVMITGGGGSIGSELARQIAAMKPKQLIILDVYENCAYDLQQELRIAYGGRLNLAIEIVTITDRAALEAAFERYHPQVVLHAAAHKHVPLMEHNCVEAVKNNVFGTLNVVDCCEKYGVEKAVMVSTDKAVNPTNVMGATKRMCEMIFQSRVDSKTSFSCTRFGNVLGSNGSVIPLFKRQIANGGPVTITDKRIIRYFMTIPEASQLVLNSGAMAKQGDLFVLDMGKSVRILDLAENMIRLSGYEPYKDIDIVETGLRPGEKLYEELLIKTEKLDKTDDQMIFIERDRPLTRSEIERKLAILKESLVTLDDDCVREALRKVVPTFQRVQDANSRAEESEEMKQAAG